jgi:hypothetical protein
VTASTIAAVVVFAGLGLVALALGLLVRRYSGHALASGLVGLLALTTASTWIIYSRRDTDVRVINKLKGEIAALNKELQGLREQRQEQENRVAASQAANDQIRTDRNTAHARLGEAQQEIERSKAASEQLRVDLQEGRAKIAVLERKLFDAQRPQPPTPQAAPSGADSADVRRKLDSRVDTPFYTFQPIEQRTLVAGLTGSWYVIRPKLGGKSFVFADGQFRLPGGVQELTESVLQLREDVLTPIRQVAKGLRLFLRGAADYRRLLGAPKELDARELRILPRLPDGTYGAIPRRPPHPAHLRNEDLPNLRADWLSQHIRSVLSLESADIAILENPPATGHERTVDIILYVEW